MAKSNDRDRDSRRRGPKDAPRKGGKKKVCVFCSEHIAYVDYKDVNLLRRFMSDRGKIRARRVSGNCAQHQREVAVAIKTARELALLPYTQRATAERGLGRGRREGPVGGPPEARPSERDQSEAEPDAESAGEPQVGDVAGGDAVVGPAAEVPVGAAASGPEGNGASDGGDGA